MKKLIIAVAIVATFGFVSCSSPEKKIEKLGKKYEKLIEQGKYDEAAEVEAEIEAIFMKELEKAF